MFLHLLKICMDVSLDQNVMLRYRQECDWMIGPSVVEVELGGASPSDQ
ncbi:hypothetical protein COMA1_40274 [Candidatus Nitrospira nitrosa]|uniref:Uncharacterized protein n=1 Tax=Candidatus Nitrospira nitrosa TaxID=1742972 RepID=A0A0S4LLL0_9BACT|nr:hypothetical protein COMA1_40274 [Candidatus Nitrospira nitrosa]